jgi:DNA polymerase
VHDEGIAEVRKAFGSLEEALKIMCPDIPWAKGIPIKAAGYRAPRYKKDD